MLSLVRDRQCTPRSLAPEFLLNQDFVGVADAFVRPAHAHETQKAPHECPGATPDTSPAFQMPGKATKESRVFAACLNPAGILNNFAACNAPNQENLKSATIQAAPAIRKVSAVSDQLRWPSG